MSHAAIKSTCHNEDPVQSKEIIKFFKKKEKNLAAALKVPRMQERKTLWL